MTSALRKIGTHDGIFHCDDVLACFMLKKLPEYVNSEIIRTRDLAILDTCDIVVDVGSVYDPARNRFDHHQKGFDSTMNSLNPAKPWKIKLSSAGLVYHHFGEKILRSILGPGQRDESLTARLYDYVYENFIMEIDAIDNGITMFKGEQAYHINTNLSNRVKHLNKPWNCKEPVDQMKLFHNAMDYAGRELIERVENFVKTWWPARKIVADALANRKSVHTSGAIIQLEEICPWQKHLDELEKENNLEGEIKYVIYNSGTWRIQAVPLSPSSFKLRLPLPEEWCGLVDDELNAASGIDGCVFVHSSGFIGGNKTREGVLEMAVKALSTEVV